MTREELKQEFQQHSGIDMTDFEYVGKFPRFKNGKWGMISRCQAHVMYAQFLEDKLVK